MLFDRYRIASFLVMLCLLSTGSKAQISVSQSRESLLLSPGDLVHVTVFDVPELEQHARITDAGMLSLELVGGLPAADLTPSQEEQRIGAALASGGFIQHAQVSVVVEQYAAADISVSGQVQHPGNYPVTTPRNLIDVLSMAGGLTPAADIHVTVKRRRDDGGSVTVSIANDPKTAIRNSIVVYPGDLVIVPKAGIVYVLGDVAHPGGYAMVNDAQLTVLQAIALAAGASKTAAENNVRLVRQTGTGPVETLLSLKSMEKGKQADQQLQAEDVVYVPYSTTKNIMLGASSILSSTSGAAIYAVH